MLRGHSRREIFSIAAAFLVFAVGTGAQIVADVLVVLYREPIEAQTWLTFRSAVLISGAVATLGFERLILRAATSQTRIAIRSLLHVLPLSLMAGLAISRFSTGISFWLAAAGSFLVALAILATELFRGTQRVVLAQFSWTTWRLVFCALLVATSTYPNSPSTPTLMVWSLGLVVAISAGIIGVTAVDTPSNEPYRSLVKKARIFLAFNLLLTLSIYLDQLLVGVLADPLVARTYVAHVSLFLAPLLFVGAIVGFLLGAYARRIKFLPTFTLRVVAYRTAFILGLVGLAFVAFGGEAGFRFMYGDVAEFDGYLASVLVAAGIVRILYMLPSALLGVLGSDAALRSFLWANAGAMLGQVVLLFALAAAGVALVHAVAIAYLLNWLARTFQGLKLLPAKWDERV